MPSSVLLLFMPTSRVHSIRWAFRRIFHSSACINYGRFSFPICVVIVRFWVVFRCISNTLGISNGKIRCSVSGSTGVNIFTSLCNIQRALRSLCRTRFGCGRLIALDKAVRVDTRTSQSERNQNVNTIKYKEQKREIKRRESSMEEG